MSSGSILPGEERASDAPIQSSPIAGRTTLGKYQILRELGAGGMGTVYLAVDSHLKRTVALKVLHKERASNETLVRRFEAEARAAAQLKNENIVTVYDAGQIEGHLFIALEFVDGTDIHELVAKRGAIPLKRSVGFIKQVGRALDHLHKQGIVHRDIKPSNLLLTKDGVVKLTDLGLARAVDESLPSNITREGTTVGTVDYMAPEQARNSQSADIRSDIYSLGCTWYQMLTGEPPFPEGSVTNKLYSHISKPRPDPRAFNQSIPDEIVAVMHKMMARKTEDRYQTPLELLHDLDNLGTAYKRLEEVLHADSDDDDGLPPSAATYTPALGSHLPLPPRHPPKAPSTATDDGGHVETERTVPEYRMPARQLPPPGRNAPPPPRQMPAPARPLPASSRSTPTPARPLPVPPKAVRGETERSDTGRVETKRGDTGSVRGESLPSKVGATNRKNAKRRGGSISNEPLAASRDPNQPLGASIPSLQGLSPLARQIGTGVAAVVALGAVIWFTVPYWYPQSTPSGTDRARNPFDPSGPEPPAQAAVENEVASKKQEATKPSANGKRRNELSKSGKAILLAETKKPAGTDRAARASSVPGNPGERAEFPAWIDDLWEPQAAVKGTALKTVTVGRVGKDPAQAASLSEALAQLPAEGGIIELRGPGPFWLPSQRISRRRQVIFSGVGAHDVQAQAKNPAADARPLIVITPPPASTAVGAKTPNGIVASEASLTFYGVDIVAFADGFRKDAAVRLVDVNGGDLIVQKCSLTLVGRRAAPTIAFSVATTHAGPGPGTSHPVRFLLDRTVVRGSDLGAVAADLQSLDLMAINSLFVTGQAPILTLVANPTFGLSSRPALGAADVPDRTLRFFSCTGCSDQSAVFLRGTSSAGAPPTTEFRILNTAFGVAAPTQAPMVALANWPTLAESSESSPRFKNLSWKSQTFVARGWQDLVASGATHLRGREADNWGKFWGDPQASVDYQTTPFPTVDDISAAVPSNFKSESSLLHQAADTSPPGCDAGLLALGSWDMIRRAEAFARRPPALSENEDEAAGSVREVDLDSPKKPDLAKVINAADWPNGTRFLVHGSKKKACTPIRVVNRSLAIELDKGLVLAFDDRRADGSDDHNAFITVTGGSIEIVNATMRMETSTRAATRRLLDVRGGSFSIRNCNLSGPRREYAGYEELIRFSSAQDESLAPGEGEAFTGSIKNSFLLSPRNLLTGNLSARNLVIENSLLVAGSRLFDLRLPTVATASAVDLRRSTFSAGAEYFHFNSKSAESNNHARFFVESTVFAPPVRRTDGASGRPALIGAPPPELFHHLDWWEYGSAYSNLIELPSAAETKSDSDSLDGWQQLAGPDHILRSIAGSGAVLLPGDVATLKEPEPGDFRLKPEALAATWSDTGKAIGAELEAPQPQSAHKTKRGSAAPKSTAPKKSTQPNTGGGL